MPYETHGLVRFVCVLLWIIGDPPPLVYYKGPKIDVEQNAHDP